ncbi:hypothetical protein AM493_17000 [Flavobacterium akiainvivens]|uniref:Beta-lactamase-inhibitor-like PepSY-like domain-containing protein n=1 Tax=Flavobacterium akiainvivens TaxID=1202724 RepID=A0A0N0RR04_9FLAO|nr:hypothetical protein [Flavobacterium akiainvivens]KOS07549.1 hypothetical protein AM493_17000 [Flavobacterium akiainvivens]SFQ77885.1 hypothetical protein SAMN05444144_12724 [Flavobacterium akiainvivens]
MKKLFLTVALVFALGLSATPAHTSAGVTEVIKQEKAFKKIETTAVPAAILKELSEKYAGYTVTQAYAAEDSSEYKIELGKDNKAQTVYYSAAGEFVKEEKKA